MPGLETTIQNIYRNGDLNQLMRIRFELSETVAKNVIMWLNFYYRKCEQESTCEQKSDYEACRAYLIREFHLWDSNSRAWYPQKC